MNRRDFWAMGVSTAAGAVATTALAKAPADGAKPAGCAKPDGTKKLDPDALAKAAYQHFIPGKLTCSEAILAAGCEALGARCKMVPDIALGLAGGVGLQGKMCGAITGGTLVISLAVSARTNEYKQKKMRSMMASGKYYNACKKAFGTCRCRNISGLDLTKPEDRKKLMTGVKAEKCAPKIAQAAKILAGIVNEA